MKILITGICGFAGAEITARFRSCFSSSTLEICGIDNLSRRGSWLNVDRLKSMGVHLHHGDIRLQSDIEAVGEVDWIVDAAAEASVLAGLDGNLNSRRLVDNNLLATVNLLEHCRTFSAGLVLLSTSRVYSIEALSSLPLRTDSRRFEIDWTQTTPAGLAKTGIQSSFTTRSPVSLYGATKLASEQLAMEYSASFNFPVWINRCGVLAGAGQFGKADQGIYSFWLHSWREKRPLKYIGFDGEGRQVRDCLHPRDLADLLGRQIQTDNNEYPIVANVSGGQESSRSLAELSDWCKDRWGDQQVNRSEDSRPFDIPWVVLDNSEVRKNWEWAPLCSTDSILEEIGDFADAHPQWLSSTT